MLKFHSVRNGNLPKLDTLVLVTCFDEDELCLAKLTFSEKFRNVQGYYNWLIQPFGRANFLTKTGVKTWAYLPTEEHIEESSTMLTEQQIRQSILTLREDLSISIKNSIDLLGVNEGDEFKLSVNDIEIIPTIIGTLERVLSGSPHEKGSAIRVGTDTTMILFVKNAVE